MNVYELWASTSYQSLSMLEELYGSEEALYHSQKELRFQLHSTHPLDWSRIPVRLEPYWDERRIPRPVGDCASLTLVANAFSAKACETLSHLMSPYSEFLALKLVPPHDDWEFWLPHIMHELEAIDLQASKVDLFDGKVLSIDEYVFRPEIIADAPVFRMPHNPRDAIYVTEPFVRRVKERGLAGFSFPLLWSDDPAISAELEHKRIEQIERQQRNRAGLDQPPVTEKRLTQSDRRAIDEAIDEAKSILWITGDEAAEIIQDRIKNTIRDVQGGEKVVDEDKERLPILLGCLWAQTICDETQWEWAKVTVEKATHWAIVPSDRSYMILPVEFIGGLLAHPEWDITSAITFNYLKAGKLKPGTPGRYLRFQVSYIVPPE